MVAESDDYRDIRSLAIHREDVVTAFETNRTTGGPHALLRVLPPFAGRMRARLHLEGSEGDDYAGNGDSDSPQPIHLEPAALLASEDLPAYPHASDTEADLRADPEAEYSIDRHHERHTEAISAWREAVAAAIVETIELDGPAGPHSVRVRALG